MQELSALVDRELIRQEMIRKHKSVYAYSKKFKLHESDVSRFLNTQNPITWQMLARHMSNLNMKATINIEI